MHLDITGANAGAVEVKLYIRVIGLPGLDGADRIMLCWWRLNQPASIT